jgi:hypothetical protein
MNPSCRSMSSSAGGFYTSCPDMSWVTLFTLFINSARRQFECKNWYQFIASESSLCPRSRVGRSLLCVLVIASLFCEAISPVCSRHREPLLRSDLSRVFSSLRVSFVRRSLLCVLVIASLFCEAISLACSRHREPLLRSDLSCVLSSSRAFLRSDLNF